MEMTAFSEQEIQQLRAGTRGTAERIHFNNAGSSLPPDVVLETVIQYLQAEAIYGGYEIEYKYREQLDNVYGLIARLINADRTEVAVVENASIAWGAAFNGMAFEKGDEVITSEMEYVTNLIGFLNVQQTHGIVIRVIPNDEQGNFSLRALEEALLAFAGCAVVVSHDRWFLDRIATHVLAFEGDSQVRWFEGNFEAYESLRRAELGADADRPKRISYKKLVRG